MKKRRRGNQLSGKRRRECHLAALNICEKRDDEHPTQLEIWGCEPCSDYPFGLIGLAEIERMNRKTKAGEEQDD